MKRNRKKRINEKWAMKMEMYGLMFLLVVSIIWGAIGWSKYRETSQTKNKIEELLGNMFHSIE